MKSIIAIAALLTFGQVAWAQPPIIEGLTYNSEGSYYKIPNAAALNALATYVNNGNTCDGLTFKVTNNITFNQSESDAFVPIGNGDEYNDILFAGTFDGQGYTISGIDYSYPEGENIGLFGYISGALIQNVVISNCSFTGNSCVGAIAGLASGVHDGANHGIFNCTVGSDVTVTAASFLIESMEEPGTYVLVPGTFVGGIIGDCSNTTLSGCSSAAALTGDDCVGGIAGRLISSRKDNKERGVIENYLFAGNVTGSTHTGDIVGARGAVIDGEDGTEGLLQLTKLTLLNDDAEAVIINATRLSRYNGIADVDVTLSGRTLTKDGNWNTLCLPFDVTISGSPLAGDNVVAKVLNTSSKLDNGTLTLNFSDAPATITAGTPFIIKWNNTGVNLTDPVFSGVTISSTTPTAVEFTGGQFVGQYSPFSITDGNKNEIIMLGSGSKLGYSRKERTLKCFRAHFYVPANGGGALARAFVMDFGDGETTEIIGATADQRSASATYTLDGRRINDLPTQKGMYIQNGRKVIIK